MKSVMGAMAACGTRGRGIAALGVLLIIYMGSSATAWALQVLEASDHAELAAEISDTDVNRIALDGDRVSRVIQSPGGFTVEHDPVRGDLYLYPDTAAFGPERAPATLYLGTEQGFTYRLSLSVVSRNSAQILIRNAAVTASSVGRRQRLDAFADGRERGPFAERRSLQVAAHRRVRHSANEQQDPNPRLRRLPGEPGRMNRRLGHDRPEPRQHRLGQERVKRQASAVFGIQASKRSQGLIECRRRGRHAGIPPARVRQHVRQRLQVDRSQRQPFLAFARAFFVPQLGVPDLREPGVHRQHAPRGESQAGERLHRLADDERVLRARVRLAKPRSVGLLGTGH